MIETNHRKINSADWNNKTLLYIYYYTNQVKESNDAECIDIRQTYQMLTVLNIAILEKP